MKLKIFLFSLIIFSGLLFIGITFILNNDHDQEEIMHEEKKQELVGTKMAIYYNGESINFNKISIDNKLRLDIKLYNDYPWDNEYNIIVVNNNMQKNFFIEEKEFKSFKIKINPNEAKDISLEMQDFNTGVNEILIIAVRENKPFEQKSITPHKNIIYRLITAYNKEGFKNKIEYNNIDFSSEAISNIRQGLYIIEDIFSFDKGIQVISDKELKYTKEKYPFSIYLAPISSKSNTLCTLLAFVDYEQQNFYIDNNSYNVLDLEIRSQSAGFFNVSLDIPDPGSHSIFYLIISYPNTETFFFDRIYFSNIVSLDVN